VLGITLLFFTAGYVCNVLFKSNYCCTTGKGRALAVEDLFSTLLFSRAGAEMGMLPVTEPAIKPQLFTKLDTTSGKHHSPLILFSLERHSNHAFGAGSSFLCHLKLILCAMFSQIFPVYH